MKAKIHYLACALSLAGFTASLNANVVFSDDFSTSTSGWFTDTNAPNITGGSLNAVNTQAGLGQTFLRYFSPQSLNVGDVVTLQWQARISGFRPSGNLARFGLFDSGGSQITTNTAQSNSAMADYDGYGVFVNNIRAWSGADPSQSATIQAFDRVNSNNAVISATAAYSVLTPNPLTTDGYENMNTNAWTALQTLELTRTATGWDYTFELGGVDGNPSFPLNISSGSFTDASPTTAFDTVVLWYVGADGATYSIDNVSLTVIPEPSTYAGIFGLLALSLVLLRRRMRS